MTESTTQHETAEQIGSEYECKCRHALGPWWKTADMHSHYPASTDDVAELMQANEYRCDRDLILRWLTEGIIPTPNRVAGNLVWFAADILPLTVGLEFRRMWKPLSKLHSHKLTRFEWLAQLAGDAGCFVDLEDWDLAGLLGLLHQPGCDQAAACAIAVALRQKLTAMGIEV